MLCNFWATTYTRKVKFCGIFFFLAGHHFYIDGYSSEQWLAVTYWVVFNIFYENSDVFVWMYFDEILNLVFLRKSFAAINKDQNRLANCHINMASCVTETKQFPIFFFTSLFLMYTVLLWHRGEHFYFTVRCHYSERRKLPIYSWHAWSVVRKKNSLLQLVHKNRNYLPTNYISKVSYIMTYTVAYFTT